MRSQSHYIVWDMGRVIAIVRGAAEARKIGAAYKGFRTRLQAEEFAAWWEFKHPPPRIISTKERSS